MTKKNIKTPTRDATATADSFVNFTARMGYGQANQLSSSTYQLDYITRNRTVLEAMYRSAWLVGAAIDFPADDMTRAGIEFDSDLDPGAHDKIQRAMMTLRIWERLGETIKWSRLFGGAIAVMLVDGQNMATPLNIDSVGKGQFKGLLVLDRWLVEASMSELITELGPELGEPVYYRVVGDSHAIPNMRIHHSRVLRMAGIPLPFYQRQAENGWGESVVERIHDRLVMFDSASVGAGQLVYKAHLRTYSIEKLRELIAVGGKAYDALIAQLQLVRSTQSNEGMTLLDASDKFETHQYTFSGLSDVILQFGQQISGALEIPLVRLFGQSPTGLNSSGESDLRTYYDGINKKQEATLRLPLTKFFDVFIRSVLGEAPPEGFTFKFASLWQMSEQEKADVAAKDAETTGNMYDRGLISAGTVLKELKHSSRISGRFTTISDDDITAAEALPPKADMTEAE